MRILLVEDEKLIGDGITVGLKKKGFSVDWFTDGLTGKQALYCAPYDAVVLDLSLPNIDGLQILDDWRQNQLSTPVLILTARDALEQRVTGFQTGADDYLCKPFALAELVARLQALIRRSHGQSSADLQHGLICFSPASRQVTKQGQPVVLTAKETRLLELFLHNKTRVLPRELIQEKLYSWNDDVSSNAVDVHIHNLRRKLGNDFIRTVYGAGYILGTE